MTTIEANPAAGPTPWEELEREELFLWELQFQFDETDREEVDEGTDG